MMRRGGAPRRFDEYFRCYPIAMMPGPDRDSANHGGKVFLPPSALDKLTRLHITYPMLFELINGAKERQTHAGVLEFIAEEGKIYMPHWLMETLLLESGDLVQIKSTDLPSGTFIKLQPQSPSFLEISDPKAVLENAFRNFSCLTTGDVFTFEYNDSVYSIAVLETRPDSPKKAICTLETDLSVDFATPVGYVEPPTSKNTGTGGAKMSSSSTIHSRATMAKAINYDAIAPSSGSATDGQKGVSSNFQSAGHRLLSRKGGSKPSSTNTSSNAVSYDMNATVQKTRQRNGPQPLRLPLGKLFFGYEIKPVKKKSEKPDDAESTNRFTGQGQTLRKRKGDH